MLRAACCAPDPFRRPMFALKLPSQIKKGAAETVHSEKKARGELVEIVDPTAHLPWRQNKGGPVWGSKGAAPEAQQANPAPDSPPGAGPGDKPGAKAGWNAPASVPACQLNPELKVGPVLMRDAVRAARRHARRAGGLFAQLCARGPGALTGSAHAQAQENPSPPKKAGPAWGGAGLAPPAVPADKKKDGADWADECEEDVSGRRERSSSIGSVPKDLHAGEMRERQVLRGGYGDRGGFGDRFGDRGYDNGAPRGVYGRDSGFFGRERLDPSQVRERWGGEGYDRNQIREKWSEQPVAGARPGDVRILRSGQDPDCGLRSQRSLSLGDSRESTKEANDAMAALAVEREQLKNEDANPRRIEDGNNPPSDGPRGVPARPSNLYLSSSHDPRDEVFLAMAAKRMQAQPETPPKAAAPKSPVMIMKRPTDGGSSSSAKTPQGKSPGAVSNAGTAAAEANAQKSPQLKAAPGNPATTPSPQQSPQHRPHQPQHQPPHQKLGHQQAGSPVGTPEELEARRRAQALEQSTPKVLTRAGPAPHDKKKPPAAVPGKKSPPESNAATSEAAPVESKRQAQAQEAADAKALVRHDTSAQGKSKSQRSAPVNKRGAQVNAGSNGSGVEQQQCQAQGLEVQTPAQEALSIAVMKEKKREMMESRQVEMMAQTHSLTHLHHYHHQQQQQQQQQLELLGRQQQQQAMAAGAGSRSQQLHYMVRSCTQCTLLCAVCSFAHVGDCVGTCV